MWAFYQQLKNNFLDGVKNDVNTSKNLLQNNLERIKKNQEVAIDLKNNAQKVVGSVLPKSNLKPVELLDTNQVTTSKGADGKLYGLAPMYGIRYSEDGGVTWVTATFPHTAHGYPFFVTKTASGYVVVTQSTANETGAIYFSTSFDSGYVEQVVFANSSYPVNFSIDYYHGLIEGEQVMLVAEYGKTTGVSRSVYGTFDGGQSWKTIFTSVVEDLAVNSHIHAVHYDKYRGRIYLSVGDGGNVGMYYSDDLGATWKEIATPINSLGKEVLQPTTIIATPTKILLGPDRDGIPVSLLSMPIKPYLLGQETFDELNNELTIYDKQAFSHYPSSYCVTEEGHIYIAFRGSDGDRQTFIVGSGDNGLTFHVVHTFKGMSNTGVMADQFLVEDSDGFIHTRFSYKNVAGTSVVKNVKFQKVDWLKV